MGINWAEHTVEIEAPIEICFDAIVDYESFAGWQGAVVQTEVLSRHDDGLGKRVKLYVDAKVRKVDYTLDYGYDRPARIWWDFVDGNGINDVDGEYTFEELGPARTRAKYRLGIESGLPLPGPIVKRAHKQTLKGSVEDLKKEAERRHAAGETAKAPAPAPEPGAEGAAPEPAPPPPPQQPPPGPASSPPPQSDSSDSLADLPAAVLGRAATMVMGIAGPALSAGRSAAEDALEVGCAVATEARNQLRRLL